MRSLALAVALSSVACGTVSYDYRKEPDPRGKEWVIGPLDQLSIVVWKNRELSGEVTVRPDGVITLPLIGDVIGAGKTPTQLKNEITHKFGDYVRSDETSVSVAVSTVNSYRFTISGNVEHAGVFTAKYYVTTLEAIAMGGGMNKFAARRFYILRDAAGKQRRVPIDYRRISSGDHPEENIVILPGDLIVVP